MIHSVADLSTKLSSQAEEVCKHLLPHGKRNGPIWEAGSLHGENGKSLKVTIEGTHAGKWRDWAEETFRGDLVDLWEHARSISKLEAIEQIKSYLGIKDLSLVAPKIYAYPKPRPNIVDLKPLSKVESYLVLERQISEETLAAFGVKFDGKSIVYECWTPKKKLVNRCFISLQRNDQGKKTVSQEVKCAPSLFGWQALPKSAFDQRSILICEGQIDAMTWHQWGYPALSVPNGSGTTWIEYEWDNLEAFETIYLSFDMDGKTEGPMIKTMQRLGLHRCRIVELPHKDANDCLLAGCDKDDAEKWITEAKWPQFNGLKESSEYLESTLEELFPTKEKLDRALKVTILQRKDGGIVFYPGDVTVWTGVSGHGKTTFLNYIMCLILSSGDSAFIASMEMQIPVLLGKVVKATMGKDDISPSDVRELFEAIKGRLLFVPRIGSIPKTDLLESMQFAFARYGCSHYLIDSLMRVEGLEEEYSRQGEFMNDLQNFAKSTDCHIHLVCHPRKIDESGRAGKMDVKGSSLIPNNADNVISIRRNFDKIEMAKERELTPQEDQGMWDLMVSSEKQRKTGWEGSVKLRFHHRTYSYSTFTK